MDNMISLLINIALFAIGAWVVFIVAQAVFWLLLLLLANIVSVFSK